MTNQNPNVDDEVGAFGVSEDVDWENVTFNDEDLTGRPTVPKKQAAPRPAAPVQESMPTQRPAVAQPAAQQPAAQQAPAAPAPSMPTQQPAPAQPQVQQPPAAPAQPRPPMPTQQPPTQQPVVQQAPAPVYTQPTQPLPVQAAPAPNGGQYSTAPSAGYAPATKATLEDLKEPDWSRIVPTTPAEDEPVFTSEAFEGPLYPNAPKAELVFAPARGRDKPKRAPKPRVEKAKRAKKEPSAREGKHTAYAGGRWKVKILRGLIFTVLGVLMLGGLKNVFMSEEPVTTAELTKQVQAQMGITGFPTGTAEAFAVRFTREYLTYSQRGIEGRNRRLGLYSPAAAAGDWGWDGTGKQSIITGPYVGAPTDVDGKDFATVTVVAQVDSGRWIALAVPVFADANGALVVAGAPAYVAMPSIATNPGKDPGFDEDADLATLLADDLLTGFFDAWAASDNDTGTLNLYLTTDASVAARTGLNDAVTLASVDEVIMPVGKTTRKGMVTVTWKVENAGAFVQQYQITVAQDGDGNWKVKDISGGVVSPTGDTALTDDSGNGPVQLPDGD